MMNLDPITQAAELLYNSIAHDLRLELDNLAGYSNIYNEPNNDAAVVIIAQQVLNERNGERAKK